MKKQLLIILLILLAQYVVEAQYERNRNLLNERPVTEVSVNITATESLIIVQNQLLLTQLKTEEFDRVAIVNMKGAVLQKQAISGPALRLDLSDLEEGVHLLILRSSTRLKEKSIKMIVRR
ncbi:MAG TPA: hypothetical protein VFV31_14115 [Chitinophagaceae bacterium]|nr:hypothetical protein [Chitinophagaceae bacterium]